MDGYRNQGYVREHSILAVSEAEKPTGPEERWRRYKQKDADGKEDMKLEDAEDEKGGIEADGDKLVAKEVNQVFLGLAKLALAALYGAKTSIATAVFFYLFTCS